VLDVDGREYVDFVGGYGALILGHADERVVAAITKAASKGNGQSVPFEMAVRLAELIVGRVPAVDVVQLVHTNFEALSFAVQTARALTGRHNIVTFEHAWHSRLVDMAIGQAAVPEIAPQTCRDRPAALLTAAFNDAAAVESIFRGHGPELAAVLVEPISLAEGDLKPAVEFLASIRSLCDKHGTLLILDETVTGLRASPGCVAAEAGIFPDLTLLGPIIGGGLPLAACGGRKDVLGALRPDGKTGSPAPGCGSLMESGLALAAGIATLQALGEEGFYKQLEDTAACLDEGLRSASLSAGVRVRQSRFGSILAVRFGNDRLLEAFFLQMLERGVLLPASAAGCMFVSAAHTHEELDRAVEAAHAAFAAIAP
jgi:glutamate-1-semialdehyde 2,1-aminomutase